MELKRGTTLQNGKYTIEKKLGQGSFGITYLATAKFKTGGNLGQMDVIAKVAIKEFYMKDINSRKEDGTTVEGSTGSIFINYKNRFSKEAENLAKLSHPHIVKVFDIFDENNTTYYVMEFLSDTNLNKLIWERKGLSEEECIKFTEEVGSALQYMHDSLMLHLDLKPGNIMIRGNESVLIDFGLSKQFTEDGKPESSTSIGQGTPGYAPLEQQNYNGKQSNELPFAMDVYALGGTMFKMITGQTPPDASSIFNDGFPREELGRHHISINMISIIEKAMAPSKKERYHTVRELLSAINQSRLKNKRERSQEKINEDTVKDQKPTTPAKSGATPQEEKNEKSHPKTNEGASKQKNKTEAILTGYEAALKLGTLLYSSPDYTYVIDQVLALGSGYIVYLGHLKEDETCKVVIRELFFMEYGRRKNGRVCPIGEVDFNKKYIDQFKRYALTLRRIKDQTNIERYIDDFDANDTHYLVTEYIEGETLDTKRGGSNKKSEKEVIQIAKQICKALESLNNKSSLHLNLQPSNIMKTKAGNYVLIGIGFSLFKSEKNSDPSTPTIGFIPGYSSLEQESGGSGLTPAADIYSLGATMYTLLTGQKPLRPLEILQNGFSTMESALKNHNVSFELIKIIKTAMSVNIKNRYQSPEALSKALSGVPKSSNTSRNKKESEQSIRLERNLSTNSFIDKSYRSEHQTERSNDQNDKRTVNWMQICIIIIIVVLFIAIIISKSIK